MKNIIFFTIIILGLLPQQNKTMQDIINYNDLSKELRTKYIDCNGTGYSNHSPEIPLKEHLGSICKNAIFKEVEEIILLGYDANTIDNTGNTPLFWAVHENNLELIQFLINQGARVDHRSLDRAAGQRKKEIVEFFLNCDDTHAHSKDYLDSIALHATIASEIYFPEGTQYNNDGKIIISLLTSAPILFEYEQPKANSLISKKFYNQIEKRSKIKTNSLLKLLSNKTNHMPLLIIEKIVENLFETPLQNIMESKYIRQFTLKCYETLKTEDSSESEKHIAQVFLNELYKHHLLKLQEQTKIKNRETANLYNKLLEESENDRTTKTADYLKNIMCSKKFEDLSQNLQENIKKSYEQGNNIKSLLLY